MGLATPAAVMVGLGRAARHGILIKGASTLEHFRGIRQIVFDKTGTLTTGKLQITAIKVLEGDESTFKQILYTLEKHSSHPIAVALTRQWSDSHAFLLKEVKEIKGFGLEGTDASGNSYRVGPYTMASALTEDHAHAVYVLRNNRLLGWIDMEDTLRSDAAETVALLKKQGIKTILLSGDRKQVCKEIANRLGMDEVYAEQTPEQKMQVVQRLRRQAPLAMVGDGINDAPALALADIGISLSDASHVAVQSANVVLLSNQLKSLPMAMAMGRHTYLTIRQNLFWAFFYNIVALPVAALGYLNPIIAAAAMGFSDVVLAVNSVRLRYKRVL